MSVLRGLVDAAREAWCLPTIVPDRCVHSRLEVASCSQCVTCCPRQAWEMDDDQLGLNVTACDGCGLCAAACTEAAIVQPLALDVRPHEAGQFAFAACTLSGVVAGDGVIPCLHAIGVRQLIDLYRRGVRRLVLALGECAACARGQAEALHDRVGAFNCLLGNRGMSPLTLLVLSHGHWRGAQSAANQGVDHDDPMSRRDYFQAMTVRVTPRHSDVDGAAEVAFAEPPGRLIPRQKHDEVALFAPGIDAQRCEACDACVRVCEYGAITLSAGADRYDLDADACSGCGLCVDVCESDAVTVKAWASQRVFSIALRPYRCTACGAPFRRPAISDDVGTALCRICTATGHYKGLFQVLE